MLQAVALWSGRRMMARVLAAGIIAGHRRRMRATGNMRPVPLCRLRAQRNTHQPEHHEECKRVCHAAPE